MPAALREAMTVATCADSRRVESVKTATRPSPNSRACSPASARQPAPNVNVGMPTVNALSLCSVSEKSAWQQGIALPPPQSRLSLSSPRTQDHVGGLLGDHDHRNVRVAGYEPRHDARVDHAQRL